MTDAVLDLVALGVAGGFVGVWAIAWLAPQRPAIERAPSVVEPPPPRRVEERPRERVPIEHETLVGRLRSALGRSREVLKDRFDALFGRPVDASLFEELEVALLQADVGMPTTLRLLDRVRDVARSDSDPTHLRAALQEEMLRVLDVGPVALGPIPETSPWVLLVIGVNGSGKTTTIGKLASRFRREGKTVLLAAADTYRAAAIEQLTEWASRADAEIVAHQEGADPGAVAYDALTAAKARGIDVVIVDTAGRLQTKKPLMDQLTKIRKVIDKVVPGAPHETLLVVDGTMGQNALSQAKLFHEAAPLTGVVITKLDGTAKGGMVLTLAAELKLPVKLIGIGEKVDDLRVFDPGAFVEALG